MVQGPLDGIHASRWRSPLDLIRGSVSVEVQGLDTQTGWQVWLVDNVPGPARSVAPEPGDKTLYVGALHRDGGVARLQAQLDARALADFRSEERRVGKEWRCRR